MPRLRRCMATEEIEQRGLCLKITCAFVADFDMISCNCASFVSGIHSIHNILIGGLSFEPGRCRRATRASVFAAGCKAGTQGNSSCGNQEEDQDFVFHKQELGFVSGLLLLCKDNTNLQTA